MKQKKVILRVDEAKYRELVEFLKTYTVPFKANSFAMMVHDFITTAEEVQTKK